MLRGPWGRMITSGSTVPYLGPPPPSRGRQGVRAEADGASYGRYGVRVASKVAESRHVGTSMPMRMPSVAPNNRPMVRNIAVGHARTQSYGLGNYRTLL